MFIQKTMYALLACFFVTHNVSAADNLQPSDNNSPLITLLSEEDETPKKSLRIQAALATCTVLLTGLIANQAHYTLPNDAPYNPQCPLEQPSDCSLRSDVCYYPSDTVTQRHYRTKKRAYQAWGSATAGKNISQQIVSAQALIDTCNKRICKFEQKMLELNTEIKHLSDQSSHAHDILGQDHLEIYRFAQDAEIDAKNKKYAYLQRKQEQQKQLQHIEQLHRQCLSKHALQKANKGHKQSYR